MISVGGLLGGVFNALVAPVIFTSVAEYPLGLALATFLVPAAGARTQGRGLVPRILDLVLPLLLAVAADAIVRGSVRGISSGVSYLVAMAACLLFVLRHSDSRLPSRSSPRSLPIIRTPLNMSPTKNEVFSECCGCWSIFRRVLTR